jgi:putative DNA methylase
MTIQQPVKMPKKLIEVALPLDAINAAAAREKAIRQGHPSTLHLWWARRPLAAARAVTFGQMVNDPSWKWELEHPEEVPPNNLKASWAKSRKRLFAILEDLVKWENTANEDVLERARAEIRKSWRETCELNKDHPQAAELFNPDKLPAFHDPFAGGGALPLEAQRLGLEAYASDLNPVAVLINKAMIEIPPKFAGRPPVNPETKTKKDLLERQWKGAQGLAEDVRYYGQWMRDEAQTRIGRLYPPVEITKEMTKDRPDLKPLVGQKLKVIAWLWARTVKSPNPAFHHVAVPLVSSFTLSSKEGKEAFVQPIVKGDNYTFVVKTGSPPLDLDQGTKASGRGANFLCLVSKTAISGDYIKAEAQAGRLGQRLLAIVADAPHGRVYLPPATYIEDAAHAAEPAWKPDVEFFQQALGFRVGNYGMTKWSNLFAPRQLIALTTFCELVSAAKDRIRQDAIASGQADQGDGLDVGGVGPTAYAEAVSVYLALAVGKLADYNSSLCSWISGGQTMRNTFGRQAVPMVWDFAEANPIGGSTGSFSSAIEQGYRVIRDGLPAISIGSACQADAQTQRISANKVVSTDPPYYDNIGYADLSDFFYVWMRKSLRTVFPTLFATIVVPKAEELVATPARHGGKDHAERFFLNGMTRAMQNLVEQAHPALPVTIYYAFKQSDTQTDSGTASTGWETFLEAVSRAGVQLSGTWPMRTELGNRMRSTDSNALASSIVLVCKPRRADAATTSRRAFLRELNHVLPEALDEMTKGSGDDRSPVAPVDLSQAIIGPGMAVFSKYSAVLEADGTPMSVRTALQLINRFLAEDDFDHDTQFCLHWFEQSGWKEGRFGDADTLARAKGTSVDGVKQAGVLFAAGGIVRLLKWSEYPADWDPATDTRLPVWEALHQIIRVFKTDGESGAGTALAVIQNKAEATRQLAYRLYTLCERAGWAEDARAYNDIVTSWSAIESAAVAAPTPKQASLFG